MLEIRCGKNSEIVKNVVVFLTELTGIEQIQALVSIGLGQNIKLVILIHYILAYAL